MGMRVDLVAAPARYPRTPLLALLLVALLPAIGLYVLFEWSDERADVYEASRDEALVDAPDDIDGVDAPIAPALPTAFFDYRRTPGSVADIANANRLARELEPVFGFIDENSCVAVSVDGVAAASIHDNVPVIPASTQKLLVGAVALELLGEDHRFVTTVAAPRPDADGVVDGDVYLIGGGDPLLTSDDYPIDEDRYPAFNTTSLDRLADAFVAEDITRITGTVIGDGTRYDDEWVIESWGEGVAFDDAGPYDALLVNDARVLGRGRQNDPNSAAARELARLLGNRGVRVNNGWGSGEVDTTARVIGTIESAPLGDIVTEMLTTSDNNTAEMLLKEIGIADSGAGTRAAGLTAVDRTLRIWGVPMEGVRLVDGSGLSPDNRLTCAAVLSVLQRHTGGPLESALPLAAVSGTLEDEFVDSPMARRMRAKTGTLGNPPFDEDPPAAKALAGYIDAGRGATIEFAMILNTPDITNDEKYLPLWIAFGERVDTYPSGPSSADLGPR